MGAAARTDNVLVKIDAARKYLATATSLQEVHQVVAMADAAQVYAKRIHASRETSNSAAEIRLRAERRLGELLAAEPKNKGSIPGPGRGKKKGGSKTEPPLSDTPTLAELGIDKKLSSRAQTLAATPAESFEAAIAAGKEGDLNPNRVGKDLTEHRQREARKQKRTAAATTAPKLDERIIVGDFRKHADKVADGSVALIFTDPPYDRKASKMLPELAEFAAAKLAEGGSLICYVGQTQLPTALDAFRQHLRYWWTIACIHAGRKTVMREYGINAGWKAVLWFVKGTRDNNSIMVSDVMSGGEEKSHHDWQQAQSEAEYWIGVLTERNGLVCDPFLGGGTTAAAAEGLGRSWIGFEIDNENARICAKRVAG